MIAVFLVVLLVAALFMATITSSELLSQPKKFVSVSKLILGSRLISSVVAVINLTIVYLAAFTSIFSYDTTSIEECVAEQFNIDQSEVNITYIQQSGVVLGEQTNKICNPTGKACHFPQYFTFCVVMVMICSSVFQQLSNLVKLVWLLCIAGIYIVIINTWAFNIFENHDLILKASRGTENSSELASNIMTPVILIVFVIALFVHARQVESKSKLDYLWKLEATEEKEETEKLQAYNKRLLHNILPSFVAEHFLKNDANDMDLYYRDCEHVSVMFATIVNFSDFYVELEANNEGVECLRLLNEIIADFDEISGEPEFWRVEKIKTIGSTYMAASGLTKETVDMKGYAHVVDMADFAFRVMNQLKFVNEHSFNNFKMRIGLNVGPCVAGVIGARKPQYDIWGNTVNVASRMDSTNETKKIQVTQDMNDILQSKRYKLVCRGKVKVKGKGEMTTYYLEEPPPEKMELLTKYNP
ncbi:adenylate cyclase type 5-like [Antedon mediterranea]|uniref:adenylate cyclase type 5-like n=1 Tax=Antedon mediterranea TaxID=105859 RepID=UPI003AF7B7A4